MEIKQVAELLESAGLVAPVLNALIANESNYKVFLMQPHGKIDASAAGVRNQDRELAIRQFGSFLQDARTTQADLVVTPEYSMPWDVLVEAIKNGLVPAPGKLWAFGCESIKYSELEGLKQDLASSVTVLFEPLQPDEERFVSPLAYVFNSPLANGNGDARTMLVQFKTHPMGDPNHFEINGMQRGSFIYQFGGNGGSLKLVSLICADAFAFKDDHAEKIYDRALILHIQLNPEPRHEVILRCRARLLGLCGDATEVLCLNWAMDVQQCCGEQITYWHNIAGSAWYLKSHEFDDKDPTLIANHRRGLYYTWLRPHYAHALFFNFKPATYLLNATKVAHIGVAGAMSRRRGPQLTKTCIWDDAATAWVEQPVAEDGFSAAVGESGHAKDELKRIAERNPLEAERVLALCAGKIEHRADWHNVRQLDSCVIDTSEVICRLTFCQDTIQRACDFRTTRLMRCRRLWDILKTDDRLPPALADFKDGFRLEWSPHFPHQNAISATGQRATVIYMGEEANNTQIEAIAKRAAECLHKGAPDPDESHNARQRLAVWFRDNDGEIDLYDSHRFVKYDKSGDTSEFDITRET